MTQIIVNILIAIYNGAIFLHVPYALGFSIIGLTVLIRLALYPLISSQLKASKKMQDLNPHLKKLKDTHKNDAKRLQQETMRLYKEHGVNPAAGCLPVIIQLPIIWGLYSVLQQVVKLAPEKVVSEVNRQIYPFLDFLKINAPWDPTFLGLPLGKTPAQLFSTMAVVAILVPVLTGFFQFIQSKMMFSPAPRKDGEKEKKNDDFASVFQSQSMYIFPIMIGFFSYTFPIGLSLYWNTFTIFGIIQQYKIAGLGGLSKWVDKAYGKK
jgi:YidC/Oxa1 family membrane protein insertase